MNNRIKEIRKSLNMTQTEFAEATGKTRDSISNLELGRVSPDKTFIELVCRKFGVDEIWLRTGEGKPFSETPADDRITASLAAAASHSETPKQRILRSLAKLPDDRFYAMEEFILSWLEENKDCFQSPKD